MKTNRTISRNDPVYDFLYKIIGNRALNAVKHLRRYRIETVGQLAGILQISIPNMSRKEAQKKGVTAAYLNVQKRHPERIQIRLQQLLQVSKSDALKIVNACKKVQTKYQHYYFNSGWALGAVKQTLRVPDSYRITASPVKVKGGFYVVPGYQDAGGIFDQGDRGTCVANATCTLLNYKTNAGWSRQFLYHQCKMVDKMRSTEGTTIEAALEILSKKELVDFGNVDELVWPYNPHTRDTEHQGPPPEKAYSCKRVIGSGKPIFIHDNKKNQDIKYLLNYRVNGKSCPVVIGIPLYESFFSWSTAETGWVTLPIPGESIVGYHAMIIVGYDDERNLFLVRNSWGPHWAQENDKGYKGHAWIPYEYIKKYCFLGASIIDLAMKDFKVHESDRLYYKKLVPVWTGRVAAAKKKNKGPVKTKAHKITFIGWLIRIAAVILLWNAYKEPVINFKNKVASYIENRIDLSEIRHEATEKWNELTE